jgi:hypothetical protein
MEIQIKEWNFLDDQGYGHSIINVNGKELLTDGRASGFTSLEQVKKFLMKELDMVQKDLDYINSLQA